MRVWEEGLGVLRLGMIGVKGLGSLHGAPGGTPSDSLGSLQTLNYNLPNSEPFVDILTSFPMQQHCP